MIAEQSEGADSYRSFRTPRELGRLVRDDLALLLSERFMSGARLIDDSESPVSQADRTRPERRPKRHLTQRGIDMRS